MLLMATSMMEVLIIYIFHLIRLGLITLLVSLGGAELMCWFLSDISEQEAVNERSSTEDEKNALG
jgi:hypothetical protein